MAAEEGLAGCFPPSSKSDVIGCYGDVDLTEEEVGGGLCCHGNQRGSFREFGNVAV